MPVSFIWFDIGYTLLYMQRELTYRQVLLEQGFDIPVDRLEREFHVADKYFMREFPGVFGNSKHSPTPWFLGVLNYRLGVNGDLCAMAARWREFQQQTQPYWLPFDCVPGTLSELKRQGLRLGVISNWDSSAHSLLESHGLARFFEHIVISSEVGCEKPGEEIFRVALRKSGVPADQCLYVGDNYYDDALGSRQVGMPCLIVNRFSRLGIEEIEDQIFIRDVSQVLDYLKKLS